VYRAIKNNTITKEDFMPDHLKSNPFPISINKKLTRSNYSLSLFSKIVDLKHKHDANPIIGNFVAKGKTDINKGVAIPRNQDSHVNYFLYDPDSNNPCSDFIIWEKGYNE
jgi:hypothetical protein